MKQVELSEQEYEFLSNFRAIGQKKEKLYEEIANKNLVSLFHQYKTAENKKFNVSFDANFNCVISKWNPIDRKENCSVISLAVSDGEYFHLGYNNDEFNKAFLASHPEIKKHFAELHLLHKKIKDIIKELVSKYKSIYKDNRNASDEIWSFIIEKERQINYENQS